ncbi:nickel pincer cofactor biosynthesis protein LarB [Candidatus Bipolaricaulota bacterium]|nr:nickel pincer cofactor biosynthesis protein LarB [Candidatus Bipolaricaulota bacterium]
MDEKQLNRLLTSLRDGDVSVSEAKKQLRRLPFQDLDHTKIDTHRRLRRGAPEAIYCEGKTEGQVIEIIREMYPEENVIATRVDRETLEKLEDEYNEAKLYPESKLAFIGTYPEDVRGEVVVVTAGTSDIPVARESEVTARSMGVQVETIFDVGVSGLHRVLSFREKIDQADVAVVVAGMEGALPSVVAGLVSTPVVAVPTDIGYGANLDGLAALLTMLNSCSPGMAVVNIGDGYGAGYFAAALINKVKTSEEPSTNDE